MPREDLKAPPLDLAVTSFCGGGDHVSSVHITAANYRNVPSARISESIGFMQCQRVAKILTASTATARQTFR
jgi:hypothetical protein